MGGCENPADGKPQAQIESPSPASESASPKEGRRYPLSADSSVAFTGSKVTGSHDGGFKSIEGAFTSDGTPENTSLAVTVDVTSMWSDSDRLTGHLASPDFLDTSKYTSATFTSTAIVSEGQGFKVSGDLSMHGVTQRISFPATVSISGDEIAASAEFSIKRFDFGIVYPGKANDLIRDDVLLKISLNAKAE
jgi:polyisoprenoid-binding protein YceI